MELTYIFVISSRGNTSHQASRIRTISIHYTSMKQTTTIHKRANATPLSNGSTYSKGGSSSPTPVTLAISNSQVPKTRARRRRKHTATNSDDWKMFLYGFLILLGCSFWAFVKVSELPGDHSLDNKDYHHRAQSHENKDNSLFSSFDDMPFNGLYHLSESHSLVGDRSNEYARLRQKYDKLLPFDKKRSLETVQRIRNGQMVNKIKLAPIIEGESYGNHYFDSPAERSNNNQGSDNEKRQVTVYDIHNCPDTPPLGYPYAWPIMTLLDNWSPDETKIIPERIYQGICVFDYEEDYEKAMAYRNQEVPFVIDDDPDVARVVERWSYPGFLEELLGDTPHRTEHSKTNKFMYYMPAKPKGRKHNSWTVETPPNYQPPTDSLKMTYKQWLEHANATDASHQMGPEQEHWYFRLIACGLTGQHGNCDEGSSEFLYDELPFFQPTSSLYLVEARAQKGLHCRFGSQGTIAENHYDGGRNSIALLGGSRRYILAHPEQCEVSTVAPHSTVNLVLKVLFFDVRIILEGGLTLTVLISCRIFACSPKGIHRQDILKSTLLPQIWKSFLSLLRPMPMKLFCSQGKYSIFPPTGSITLSP